METISKVLVKNRAAKILDNKATKALDNEGIKALDNKATKALDKNKAVSEKDIIQIDAHSHSKYSFDSSAEPERMVLSAIEKGIKNLCLTEHLDIDETNLYFDHMGRFSDYFRELSHISQKYKDRIDIIIGVEAGWNAEFCDAVKKIVESFPFEYIINSVHVHGKLDYYQHENYKNVDKTLVYAQYLDIIYDSLNAPYRFDAVGHLGYPTRFAPYSDNRLEYETHKAAIDRILGTIVKKELILEVNTSVYKSQHTSLASFDILKNYYDIGGRYITFSSDAHSPASLGRSYAQALSKIKQIGFKYLTKSKNGIKTLLPI